MRSLSRREHVGSLFYVNATVLANRQLFDSFLWYAESAVELAPRDAMIHNELARGLGILARHDSQKYGRLLKRSKQLEERAAELGYVPVELVPRPKQRTPGNQGGSS